MPVEYQPMGLLVCVPGRPGNGIAVLSILNARNNAGANQQAIALKDCLASAQAKGPQGLVVSVTADEPL